MPIGNSPTQVNNLKRHFLPLGGGTLTGALTLSGAPTVDLHAATKKYVDDNAGAGDVTGPGSSTDHALPRFDGTGGKTLQGSSVIVDDSDNVTGIAALTVTGTTTLATGLTGVLRGDSGVVSVDSNVLSNVSEDTTPQLGGDLDGQANDITDVILDDYGVQGSNIGSIGGGTQDLDLEAAHAFRCTVDTSTTTFTFSNPKTYTGFILELTNGGSQTVNWPASVDWAGGTAPTLTTSGVDILSFTTFDGGTKWHGVPGSLDSK